MPMQQKKVYAFNPENGEFIGDTLADESPSLVDQKIKEQTGKIVWLMPAFSTEIQPPEPQDGHYVSFDVESQSWRQIEIPPPPLPEVIDEETGEVKEPSQLIADEREFRLIDGFFFQGNPYQGREQDFANITGASVAALSAVISGAKEGDFRWHGGDTDFTWIDAVNRTHVMDAHTMLAFARVAMAHKQGVIYAARNLKNMDPIPSDYKDDKYWPVTRNTLIEENRIP